VRLEDLSILEFRVKSFCLVVLFCSCTLSGYMVLGQTVPVANTVLCEEETNCTHQLIDGYKFKILTTDNLLITASLASNGHLTRIDLSVTNLGQKSVDLLPRDMILEVILPKPKNLAFVSPEQIAKSAEHRAGWANVLNSMGAAMATQQTTTQTNSSGTVQRIRNCEREQF
jgi:hypothetical protein